MSHSPRVEPTPWSALLGAANRIGVTPPCFWRLSLKEWRALIALPNDTLRRAAFEALAQRFPDKPS